MPWMQSAISRFFNHLIANIHMQAILGEIISLEAKFKFDTDYIILI